MGVGEREERGHYTIHAWDLQKGDEIVVICFPFFTISEIRYSFWDLYAMKNCYFFLFSPHRRPCVCDEKQDPGNSHCYSFFCDLPLASSYSPLPFVSINIHPVSTYPKPKPRRPSPTL